MRRKIIILSLCVTVLLSVCKQKEEAGNNATDMQTFLTHVSEERRQAKESADVDTAGDFWYKTGFIYTLDVETFKDSNGDGIGDFNGLTDKLEYLKSLGVDAIWLSPFQPTPNKDDGYDVSDYYNVDPRLGTMHDFQRLIVAANKLHIWILMDLVVNHTSDEIEWFKQGRSPQSPYHNWYVWSKEKPANMYKGMVFPGVQQTIWSYDTIAQAYFYHRFYIFQPDLNMQNPAVREEIHKIIRHWLQLGIAGFRLDGVPFFIEVPQTHGVKFEHQFFLLTQMRHLVKAFRRDGVVIGEANVTPEENKQFFGEKGGDGLDVILTSLSISTSFMH